MKEFQAVSVNSCEYWNNFRLPCELLSTPAVADKIKPVRPSKAPFHLLIGLVLTLMLALPVRAQAGQAADLAAQATSRYTPDAIQALFLLGNLGSEARYYRAAMVPGLMSPVENLRHAAARALKNSGTGAGLAVLPMVQESSLFGRLNATLGFGAMGQEGVAPLIRLLREDPHRDVRRYAAITLSHMGNPAITATPDLTSALEDPDDLVRVSAKSALSLLSCSRPVLAPLAPPRGVGGNGG